MPCLSTKGTLVPADTVIFLPSEAALAECNCGTGAGSVFGVMGPSICWARREPPAKKTRANRDSMRHLAKKFTAALDTGGVGGAFRERLAMAAANRQRCASGLRLSATSAVLRRSPAML